MTRETEETDKYLIDAATGQWPLKPSGESMNGVYDRLRLMTVDDLREIKRRAEVEYLTTGNRNCAIIAHQCSETYRRWLDGVNFKPEEKVT